MIISKATLNKRAAVQASLVPGGDNGVYDAHQLLWKLFADGPERRRDFVYREMEPGVFITVSARPPQDTGKLWTVQSKPYAPQLHEGERIHFTLRANPMRKTHTADGRQQRHDIVQDARKRWLTEHDNRRADMPSRHVLAQEAGWHWFAARAAAIGLALDEADRLLFEVERYMPCSFAKRRAEHTPPGKRKVDSVSVSQLDMAGFATVHDPQALCHALFNGVGSAKAFGCGLLLVRRSR